MNNMPKIENVVVKSDEEREILARILNKGCLRATKPKVTDAVSGKAAYVWRMVAFTCSPIGAHQCMPVTADFDLPRRKPENEEDRRRVYDETRALSKELDEFSKRIEATVPLNMRHGLLRWGRLLGAL